MLQSTLSLVQALGELQLWRIFSTGYYVLLLTNIYISNIVLILILDG